MPKSQNMPDRNLRILFGGTPDFAAAHLKHLLDRGYNVVGVYTQPDRISGRGRKLTPSPVKELALERGLPVAQPENFQTEASIEEFASFRPDLFVVVAYGIILPRAVLDMPSKGCINVHGSLLPKYRGAAPIQRSIFFGDRQTGVTIMQMNEGLDTGDIILSKSLEILPDDTTESLFRRLEPVGCTALTEAIESIAAGTAARVPQNESDATYARKITQEEAKINFREPADMICRRVRTYIPWPGAFIRVGSQNVKILKASVTENAMGLGAGTVISLDRNGIAVAAGYNAVLLETLQFPGKKPASAADIINGRRELFMPGTVFE